MKLSDSYVFTSTLIQNLLRRIYRAGRQSDKKAKIIHENFKYRICLGKEFFRT
jgi:hypothetical protein